MERRKITYRLYPSKGQTEALGMLLRSHQQLYNAALEQRIDAWRRRRVSLSYQDQCKELTSLRAECPEFTVANCSSQQRTLRRLDIAFQAFFRRVAARGERAGFPRFKSLDAFPGFGFKSHGDGWRFTPGADWKHGRLRLQGVGTIKARGQARQAGEIKSCEMLHRDGQWLLSLTIECATIERQGGCAACGLDWGVESFATLALDDGGEHIVANPRRVAKAAKELRKAQRALARKRRGGKTRQRARKAVSRLHRRLANQRKEFLHQTSAALVARFAMIATEDLSIRNMTASAKGNAAQPGKNVRAKAGLNREILDTAPGAFLAMLRYKATEAGTEYIEVPTRKLKPSQTCPACGRVEKKPLRQRHHACPACGHTASRDGAAARVMLNWAMAQLASPGREPARQVETSADISPPATETPSTAA